MSSPVINEQSRNTAVKTHINVDRAKELLDYAPTITVEQGVREFWLWYQDAVMGGSQ